MNKFIKTIAVVLSIVALNSCTQKSAETDTAKQNLKGNVAEVIEFNHQIESDSLGNILIDTITSSTKYEFNTKGYITKIANCVNDTITHTQVSEINKDGSINKLSIYEGDEAILLYSVEFEYYTPRRTKQSIVFVDGIERNREEYTYDGNQMTVKTFENGSLATEKAISKLDENDHIVEHASYTLSVADSTEVWDEAYTITSQYNEVGRQIAAQYSIGEDTLQRIGIVYNSYNDPVKYTQATSYSNMSEEFEYEYDTTGNWIKRTEYAIYEGMRIAIGIVERTITYAE